MDETTEPWDKGIPADLIPAIKHLRKSFDEAHWGFGQTSRVFCYALLHEETADDPANEHRNFLMYMKARVGAAATRRFNDLIRENTPPAIFKAFYDLYVEGLIVQVSLVFKELVEIGRANERRLEVPSLQWAEAQMKQLIRSETHSIKIWVRNVCDKQPFDPNDDSDELIFWRKWQAPALIVMKPSRSLRYDPEKVWDRSDAKTSSRWLDAFAQDYVLRLEIRVKKLAGEAAVELAKLPSLASATEFDTSLRAGSEPPTGESPRSTQKPIRTRLEKRKLKTQARYRAWKAEYRRLAKIRPEMSDVWYSQQIAKAEHGKGSSAETIRKHMKR